MNYTKGGWSVSYNGERDELGRYSVVTNNGRVATIQPHKDESVSLSNARLIAAAPEMYEALGQIASCKSVYSGDVVNIAKKVLSKMEG